MKTADRTTKIFRVFIGILAGFIILAFVFIVIIGLTQHFNQSKHQDTPLGVTLIQVKEIWGEPDGIYPIDPGHLEIYYNKGFLTTSYEFVFDKDSILIEKKIDD